MVQVGFVHDHHAGVAQRLLIDEPVPGIVADMVERDVECAGIETLAARTDRKPSEQTRCAISADERLGVVCDAAFRGRHRGEECNSHGFQ